MFNKIVNISDSIAASQTVLAQHSRTIEQHKIISSLHNEGKVIALQLMPVHCRVSGNETADTLAKKGSLIDLHSNINLSIHFGQTMHTEFHENTK